MSEHGKDFVYIHIPKTGGNWVRENLRPLGTVVKQPYHGVSGGLAGKLVFTFVRHPALWLRSFYAIRTRSNWALGGRDLWRDICVKLQPYRDMDFPGFAACVAEQPGVIGDFYREFMVPGICVGRTELLAEDLKYILPRVDVSRSPVNVGRDLPPIDRYTWELICKAEEEVINRYYFDGLVTYENHERYIMAEKKVDPEEIKKAAEDLGIDVPIMATRMVGNRIELHLYGGAVVMWPEVAAPAVAKTAAKKKNHCHKARR